jgi:hypothetical protein
MPYAGRAIRRRRRRVRVARCCGGSRFRSPQPFAPLLLLYAALDAAGAADPDLRLHGAADTLDSLARTERLHGCAPLDEVHRLAAARAGARLGRRGHVARIPSRSPGPALAPASSPQAAPRWDSYPVRAAAVAAARELERRRPEPMTSAGGRRNAAAASSSTTTRTRRTRPSSTPGRCALVPALRCRRPDLGRDRHRAPRRADDRERARAARDAG